MEDELALGQVTGGEEAVADGGADEAETDGWGVFGSIAVEGFWGL